MFWKNVVAAVVLTPVAALFVGVGVLAYNVSQTWDARNTDALISGLVAACGMGGIVTAGLLAAIVGIPFALRLLDKARADRYSHGAPARMIPARPSWHVDGPPQLVDQGQAGSWQTRGPAAYELWDDPGEGADVRPWQ